MEFIDICLLQLNEFASQNPSPNQKTSLSQNLSILSSLLIGYIVLSILTKKSAFLLAFLLCVFLQSASVMLAISEAVVYLLVFLVYSYVYNECYTVKSKVSCVTIMALSLVFYFDSVFFGVNGIYGTDQTVIYQITEYLSLFAHIFFICSFINLSKIRHYIRNFISALADLSRSVYYLLNSWYNIR